MKVDINGLPEAEDHYARILRRIRPSLVIGIQRAVTHVWNTVPDYPVQPPGSSYRRTGTLGREIGTEVRPLGDAVIGIIGSPTVYAPWVISSEAVGGVGPQARVHRGRWWTLQEVVAKARSAVLQILEDAIRGALQ